MVLFKINGERNSGTTFLSNILKINNFPIFIHELNNKKVKFWKHGIPNNKCKNLNNRVIDIFIFRNLNDWLISMYKNPYELKKKFNNFNKFLKIKHESNNYWKKQDGSILNDDDNNKTIFEIRYYKFKKICEYKKLNKDVIFVNLSFLQNKENLYFFLNILNNKYIKNPCLKYITELKHTKINKNIKNRIYNIEIKNYKSIIDFYKNINIENYINNLTYIIS